MLLRVVLFLGFGLITVAGGAAGWQYWQSLPLAAVAETAPSAAPRPVSAPPSDAAGPAGQNWLISAGGGLVPRDDVRNFLAQNRFDDTRDLSFQFRAPLTALLSPGEVLPGDVFAEAFAEVRAMAVATHLCEPLLQAWAQGCAVASAELVEDSYDPRSDTAAFRVNVLYSVKAEAAPLPDLGSRSFWTEAVRLDPGDAAETATTPEAFLTSAIALADRTCKAVEAQGQPCRVMQIALEWDSPADARGFIRIGTLGPLPKGVYPAPPLY